MRVLTPVVRVVVVVSWEAGVGLTGPRALESSSLVSSNNPIEKGGARRRSSLGDPLTPESGKPDSIQVDARNGWELRIPNSPTFLTKPNTSSRKAFARAPRAPFKDRTKGTNKGDEQSTAFPSRRLDPGVANLSHFDLSKKSFDTTVHVHTAAPHGRATHEASYGHVHQDTSTRGIMTAKIGPPWAGAPGISRVGSTLHP